MNSNLIQQLSALDGSFYHTWCLLQNFHQFFHWNDIIN